jgi:endogenous inhibitor of DNA gyrase (YacG/DUF329 family)
MVSVNCPTCQALVDWNDESKWKPFCSERCKLIDLGDWVDEKHKIVDNDDKQEYLIPEDDMLR